MEMTGEQRIAAPRERVWEALNDPEILKQCIPGCQSIEKSDENSFAAKVKAKVGPVNSTFSGTVTLSDLNPPESYTISGQGSGGAAGFAKGSARVSLEEDGGETILRYTVDAQVGGKLAQVGQRLIQSTANKYAKQFFDSFTEKVGAAQAAETAAEAEQPQAETAPAAEATEPPATGEAPAAAPAGETAAPSPEAEATAGAGTTARAQSQAPQEAAETVAETAGGTTQPGSESQPAQEPSAAPENRRGLDPKIWVPGLIALIVILLAILSA
ncbi:hypothetical protein SAMN05216241_102296 [Limimonas halophila]|uniref:Carbon monoxide dehydrogenase subunit G n=1 Tax=Limimonas halophila TaxID=1082479 RepID=A0A1G7NT12_9PROT|nr:carbon monoxide dehydrogenase subunit G [Limimonas halophila]SDF77164.1 hypothetical protein SAMN05216241_102296 [Limimonas halophila]